MRLFSVCLCLAGWLATGSLALAQKANITGVLKKIDIETGLITILPGKLGAGKEMTFSLLKPDLVVTTELGPARLADLASGNTVHLQLNDDEDVEAIRADVPIVRAALMANDSPKKTIRVLTENLTSKELTVKESTRITLLGKTASLADLRVYQWLEVTASLDGKTALAIDAHAPGTRNRRVSSGKLKGEIVVLDVPAGILLFHCTKRQDLLFSFAASKVLSTWFMFDTRPVEVLAGPHPFEGQPATVYLAPDRTAVTRILTDAPLLRCQVKSVDLEKRRLIVAHDGATQTWELPADVKVMKGRRRGKLEEVQANTFVELVLSLDRTRLRGIAITIPQ